MSLLVAEFPGIINNLLGHDQVNSKNKIFNEKKISESYELYKLKVEEWLQMQAIKDYHVEKANLSIYSFIKLLHNKQKAALLDNWFKSLMNIGKNTGKEKLFLAEGRSLFATARKDGVYSKEKQLFEEACLILNLKAAPKNLTDTPKKKKK